MDAGGQGHESQTVRGSQAKAKAIVREVKLQCQEKGGKSGWSWRDLNKCLDRGMEKWYRGMVTSESGQFIKREVTLFGSISEEAITGSFEFQGVHIASSL